MKPVKQAALGAKRFGSYLPKGLFVIEVLDQHAKSILGRWNNECLSLADTNGINSTLYKVMLKDGGLAAMEIFAYGEDALTLWALQNKLALMLQTLGDDSAPAQCQIFFRPSFGRRGGEKSAQFGEFDFIVLTTSAIYLGESKWPYSSEQIIDGILKLRDEQMVRHDLFKFYIEEWAFGNHDSWHNWTVTARDKLCAIGIKKPLAPELSLLAANLQVILRLIRERYAVLPPVHNVLLFLHSGAITTHIPVGASTNFKLVPIDYSEGVFENFIRLT